MALVSMHPRGDRMVSSAPLSRCQQEYCYYQHQHQDLLSVAASVSASTINLQPSHLHSSAADYRFLVGPATRQLRVALPYIFNLDPCLIIDDFGLPISADAELKDDILGTGRLLPCYKARHKKQLTARICLHAALHCTLPSTQLHTTQHLTAHDLAPNYYTRPSS